MKVDLKQAREKLLQGDVVAIPTETVYGLGGWINSADGLKKIFSIKERPFFDPLIVHIDGIENAKKLSRDWTKAHEVLARAFWPGPLTLIALKNDKVDPLITSGLDSVGLRCPRHSLTLQLLSQIEGGVAAPSANKFGKTSPTTYSHVEEEFEGKVAVLEGGQSEVGIESTVVGISRSGETFKVEIFRPGFLTAKHIEEALSNAGLDLRVHYTESPVAPGQLKHHYMPKIPLVIVPQGFVWNFERDKIESVLGKSFSSPALWMQPEDPRSAARELYEKMRTFDRMGYDLIVTYQGPEHQSEEWLGIWNRLGKAKTLSLLR